jgi:hypothetical protein
MTVAGHLVVTKRSLAHGSNHIECGIECDHGKNPGSGPGRVSTGVSVGGSKRCGYAGCMLVCSADNGEDSDCATPRPLVHEVDIILRLVFEWSAVPLMRGFAGTRSGPIPIR